MTLERIKKIFVNEKAKKASKLAEEQDMPPEIELEFVKRDYMSEPIDTFLEGIVFSALTAGGIFLYHIKDSWFDSLDIQMTPASWWENILPFAVLGIFFALGFYQVYKENYRKTEIYDRIIEKYGGQSQKD